MGTGTGSQAHRHRRGSGSRPGVPEPDEAQVMVLDWGQLDIGAAQRSRSSSAVHFTEREHRAAWRGVAWRWQVGALRGGRGEGGDAPWPGGLA